MVAEQRTPPVEAILAAVLQLRPFLRWLQRSARHAPCFPEAWIYQYLAPELPPARGRVSRCTVVLPGSLIIDDVSYPTLDWMLRWCRRWESQRRTAAEAVNTLVFGTTDGPGEPGFSGAAEKEGV